MQITRKNTAFLTLAALSLLPFAGARPAAAQTINNFSFESPTGVNFPGYTDITGWTSGGTKSDGSGTGIDGGGVGVASGSPFANNGVIPDGQQVGFIQAGTTLTHSLSQTITGLTIGNQYSISFYDNARADKDNPTLSVSFGGVVISGPQIIAPVGGSNPYNLITSNAYTATGTSADLVFSVAPINGDATALLDAVTIKNIGSPVPEASATISLGLLLTLGGLAVLTARKRSAKSGI